MAQTGKLDRRIELFTATETRNRLREVEKSWTSVGKFWASVEFGSGAERRIAAEREEASLPAMIRVRANTLTKAIRPSTHRLEYNGHVWDIESAAPSPQRGRFIDIVAKAKI